MEPTSDESLKSRPNVAKSDEHFVAITRRGRVSLNIVAPRAGHRHRGHGFCLRTLRLHLEQSDHVADDVNSIRSIRDLQLTVPRRHLRLVRRVIQSRENAERPRSSVGRQGLVDINTSSRTKAAKRLAGMVLTSNGCTYNNHVIEGQRL